MTSYLSEYERLRNEKVARNADRLAQLGLVGAVQDLTATQRKRPKSEGRNQLTNKSKRPKAPAEPVRRSLRSQGLSPEGEDVDSKAIIVQPQRNYNDRSTKTQRQMSLIADNEAPTTGPIQMRSNNAEEDEDKNFVDMLQTLKDEQSLRDRQGGKQDSGMPSADYAKLQLSEDDVAKVVKDRIYTLEFLPIREKLLVAAGDKFGQLGLWEVGGGASPSGVFNYTLHTKPVAGLVCSPQDCTKLFTCSYDGSARMMDVNAGSFQELTRSGDNMFSTCCLSSEGNKQMYLGDYEGSLTRLDPREGKRQPSVELHEKKINSLHFHPTRPHLLLSSSTDACARVWDTRKLNAKGSCTPLAEMQHQKAVHGAYFSRGGDQIACTSYDNTVSIWSESKATWQKKATIRHNNTTGRWLTAFRAMWAFDDSHLLIGSMNRCVDLLSTQPPHAESTLTSQYCTTVPARVAVHPLIPVVAAGNASGRVYIWKPVSS